MPISPSIMSQDNVLSEYTRLNSRNQWANLFAQIRSESLKNSGPCTESQKPKNKILNRYRDVSPFDKSRIILKRGPTDYINANLICVDRAKRKYILTQGPLANTVGHFWLMVWEQESKAILMLNKLVEKKQEKCYQYWPGEIGSEHAQTFEEVGLKVEYLQHEDHSYYLTRRFRLTDVESDISREIVQFHYTTWPDFGVPSSPTAFLEFLKRVRDAGVLEEDVGPAIVHCSAGIGRSGTFCLVDSCLILIEKFGVENVDVKEILYEIRTYREGLIQTAEQLKFSYQAIIEGANLKPDTIEYEENKQESNNVSETSSGSEEEDECESTEESEEEEDQPPPLPPPRLDSLSNRQNEVNADIDLDKPLPGIPASVSLIDCTYESDENGDVSESVPSRPLPNLPVEEDEEGDNSEKDNVEEAKVDNHESESLSPNELTHRKRAERKEKLEAKVNEMKRRQKANEKWTQLKRPKTTHQD